MKIFVSYAHDDAAYKNELMRTCAVLTDAKKITLWTDDDIRAGDMFDNILKEKIESCDMYILLLSSIYWSKEYIKDNELPKIIDVAKEYNKYIIPIVLNGANRIKYTSLNGMLEYDLAEDYDESKYPLPPKLDNIEVLMEEKLGKIK